MISHLVILAFVGLNLLYVAFACPFDLSPDEAHYWDWSRRLDYCYYSKGPLVAWLIRGSCELFGDTAFAVRLPAVLCGGLLLLGLHRLTRRAAGDERLSLFVVLVAISLPPVAAGSVLMTIDPPFLVCWVWACVCIVPASSGGRGEIAGLLVAVGTLAKFTMLLFPACVLGWLIASRQPFARRHLGFFALSALGLVPILWWNATHDWIGVRHLLGHGGAGEPWAGPVGVLAFLGGQLGLLLGVWLVLWVLAVSGKKDLTPRPPLHEWRRGVQSETVPVEPRLLPETAGRFAVGGTPLNTPSPFMERGPGGEVSSLLHWLSVPVFAVFLLTSVRTAGQPNWPLPAYLTGAVLVAVWVRERWANRFVRRAVCCAVVVGLAMGLAVRFPGAVRPLLARFGPAPTEERPAPVRQLDPTARLLGWQHLAARVDAVRDRVTAETGTEPLLAGMTWIIPGELGFYCRGHPTAYNFGAALADRGSQYDVWRPNPVFDAQAFAGRTFVYVGEAIPAAAFSRVELAEAVVARDDGVPVANWKIWVCRGFRGFPPPADRGHPIRF